MAKKKTDKAPNEDSKKPKVNPELDGFDIEIDSFGEIKTNFDIDKINAFLNRNVDDKKLRDRDDIDKDGKFNSEESEEDKE
ncbi:MAG TPA: hypothetical protein DCE41_23455 [Cytophagales bacterium]|nr:hypothetical protein [Cytophagales bacterium]HAA23677.1 hypothetical protein [Cytophagales bacterium]HAP59248.1 hypothetical protein [Cytophagales bacterium]